MLECTVCSVHFLADFKTMVTLAKLVVNLPLYPGTVETVYALDNLAL